MVCLNRIFVLIILVYLSACAAKPSNEMEEMSRDVLKAHQGIEIEIKPIPKDLH
jgi:hypothetical protein